MAAAVAAVLALAAVVAASSSLQMVLPSGGMAAMEPYRLYPLACLLQADATVAAWCVNFSNAIQLPVLHSSALVPDDPTLSGMLPGGYWGTYLPEVELLSPPTSFDGSSPPTLLQLLQTKAITVGGHHFKIPHGLEMVPAQQAAVGVCPSTGFELTFTADLANRTSIATAVAAQVPALRVSQLFFCDQENQFVGLSARGDTLLFTLQVRSTWVLTSVGVSGVGNVTFEHHLRDRSGKLLRGATFAPANGTGTSAGRAPPDATSTTAASSLGVSIKLMYDPTPMSAGVPPPNRLIRVVTAPGVGSDPSTSAQYGDLELSPPLVIPLYAVSSTNRTSIVDSEPMTVAVCSVMSEPWVPECDEVEYVFDYDASATAALVNRTVSGPDVEDTSGSAFAGRLLTGNVVRCGG